MSRPRPVTPLVPAGPGLRYWSDRDNYDALVDDTCFPTCFDDPEDLRLTPADARRLHFQDVAAGSDMTGATARERGDAAGTAPAPCAPSSLAQSAGAGATNVRSRPGRHNPDGS